ncbi:hypothetical protein [Actinomadura sp. 3N407]|uniref:hypothetical protein n=1 Tax=Actinomadura sp. 3N407 TaxID=3457423 RepID=UPI003FCC68CA
MGTSAGNAANEALQGRKRCAGRTTTRASGRCRSPARATSSGWSTSTRARAALLDAWLAADDRPSGPLFKPVHRSGAVQHRPMTDAAVRNVVVKRRRQAALPPMTPHDWKPPAVPLPGVRAPFMDVR